MRKRTPWGEPDSEEKLAEGLIFYGTPSHGGIWISNKRKAQLPDGLTNFCQDLNWWEEDCDWCIPYIVFKEDIEKYDALKENNKHNFKKGIIAAYDSLENWQPEEIRSMLV